MIDLVPETQVIYTKFKTETVNDRQTETVQSNVEIRVGGVDVIPVIIQMRSDSESYLKVR